MGVRGVLTLGSLVLVVLRLGLVNWCRRSRLVHRSGRTCLVNRGNRRLVNRGSNGISGDHGDSSLRGRMVGVLLPNDNGAPTPAASDDAADNAQEACDVDEPHPPNRCAEKVIVAHIVAGLLVAVVVGVVVLVVIVVNAPAAGLAVRAVRVEPAVIEVGVIVVLCHF